MILLLFILILMNIANLFIMLMIYKDIKHYYYCLEYMFDSINIHILDLDEYILKFIERK